MVKRENNVKKSKLWRQNNSLSKVGGGEGVGREGLLKILGGPSFEVGHSNKFDLIAGVLEGRH